MAPLALNHSLLSASMSTVSSIQRRTRTRSSVIVTETLNASSLPKHFRIDTTASRWMRRRGGRSQTSIRASSYTVEVEHNGELHSLQVEEGESVLDKALEIGLDVPHDCKLGVCMTCPAKLLSGSVDQSGGMLSDDVVEKGYALLCVAMPLSDCRFRTIPEDELLSLQLVTAQQ